MAGIEVLLLISFQMRLYFFNRTDRQGNGYELTALLGVNPFGQGGNGFVRIFTHAV